MGRPMEIAIIGTEFLRDFISEAMNRLDLELKFTLHTYASFRELADIYRSLPESAVGVITSGSFPARIIEKTFPETGRVIRPFNNDDAGLYKFFLRLLNENRALNISRVYADILEAAGLDLDEYLFGEREATYSETLDEFTERQSLEELLGMDDHFADKHLALWRAGRVDLSVTRFSNIATRLSGAGLAVRFAFPSIGYLGSVCQETMQAVRIAEMRGHQTAAVRVTARPPEDGSAPAARLENLGQMLRRFQSIDQLDFLLRPAPQGFELLTNRLTVSGVTENYQCCRLQTFLMGRLGFDVQVGYGIGDNLHQARLNAIDANREAGRFSFGASCLIDERGHLIGPLKKGTKLVVSREVPAPVREAALKSGLSYLSVQKVLAAVTATRDGRITARELAHKLAVTARSGNRLLTALAEAGQAEVVEIRRGTTKGRPERIYKMTMGAS